MEAFIALQVKPEDNVAVLFAQGVAAGSPVSVQTARGESFPLTARQAIPFGHKIAVRAIGRGEVILKYGEAIGEATREIEPGEHVHVHNLDSQRGRGDL